MPFEHVLPREIILHINWLTVGACRETENRYSKYVQNDANTVNTITTPACAHACVYVCLCVCISERWKNFHISRHANVVWCCRTYEFQSRQYRVRKAHSERDNRGLCLCVCVCMNAFFRTSSPHAPHKDHGRIANIIWQTKRPRAMHARYYRRTLWTRKQRQTRTR